MVSRLAGGGMRSGLRCLGFDEVIEVQRKEARELLAPVYGWFTEGFDTLDLKEARAYSTSWPLEDARFHSSGRPALRKPSTTSDAPGTVSANHLIVS